MLSPEAEVTKSLYKSIYKSCQVTVQEEDTLVIDNNDRVAQEIERLKTKMVKRAKNEGPEDALAGFSTGLDAEQVDSLLSDENGSLSAGSIIRQEQEASADMEEISAQAEAMLAQAREEAETIKAKAAQNAEKEAEQARSQAFDEGKRQGYEDGYNEGMAQIEGMRQQLEEEKIRLESEYRSMMEELEPEFVSTITNIYEQVFKVDLKKEHDIVMHLLETAMQKMEGNGNYLIHVSREDYPYVSMKKEEILSGAVSGNASVEIVEDVTLSSNDCMIETDSGIFDCGLGTQLEELSQKLKLLSYSGQ